MLHPYAACWPRISAKPFAISRDEGLLYLSGAGRLINQRQVAGGRLRLCGRPVWSSVSADPLQDEASVSPDPRRLCGLGELIRNNASALGRVPVQASRLAESVLLGKFLRNFPQIPQPDWSDPCTEGGALRDRVTKAKCLPSPCLCKSESHHGVTLSLVSAGRELLFWQGVVVWVSSDVMASK